MIFSLIGNIYVCKNKRNNSLKNTKIQISLWTYSFWNIILSFPKGVFQLSQNSKTETYPSDVLGSYQGHSGFVGGAYPSAELQSTYSTAQRQLIGQPILLRCLHSSALCGHFLLSRGPIIRDGRYRWMPTSTTCCWWWWWGCEWSLQKTAKSLKQRRLYSDNFASVNIYIFTNPSAQAGYDTRSIFKRSLTGLNSEFSFS